MTNDKGQMTNILIRVPNWVGDVVMAVPALREFRRIFADAEVTLLARSWVSGLFAFEEFADHIVEIEDVGRLKSPLESIRLIRKLRSRRFDIAILLQNAFSAALFTRLAAARQIAGYPTDGRRRLLDLVIPFANDLKTSHQVFYYLRVASHIEEQLKGEVSVSFANPSPTLRVSADAKENAWRNIVNAKQHGMFQGPAKTGSLLPGESKLLVLNPGATNSRAKRWLPERFAAVADRLADHDGFTTVIVGAKGDVEASNETAGRMRTPAIVLTGQTNIAELKAILSCSSLVVSNDTGTAHVSAALGVPTVVVFGPTEHVSTRPYSNAATVVRHEVECSPCMLRDCPIDHRCMTRVEVDDVYRAAKSLLVTV